MTMIKNLLCCVLVLFFNSYTFANIITDSDYDYFLDIPEGYTIIENDNNGTLLSHNEFEVSLIIKNYSSELFNSSGDVLKSALQKLNAQFSIDNFVWNDNNCSISSIVFTLDKEYFGWAICSPTKNNNFVVLICYSTNGKKLNEQFIISTLNSLCTDEKSKTIPGIITSYAYKPEGKKSLKFKINSKEFVSQIDKIDEEAAQFVVELEFSVLIKYVNSDLKLEAWKRYYRQIYKDNFSRLNDFSTDFFECFYPDKNNRNLQNDLIYAQTVLSYVQSFNYNRAKSQSQSDFTNLVSAICGQANDCDSRSMLVISLLNKVNIRSIFLFSPEYSHAMVGLGIFAPGQKYYFKEEAQEFLYGETTQKLTWGIIAQDFLNQDKWIALDFTH